MSDYLRGLSGFPLSFSALSARISGSGSADGRRRLEPVGNYARGCDETPAEIDAFAPIASHFCKYHQFRTKNIGPFWCINELRNSGSNSDLLDLIE